MKGFLYWLRGMYAAFWGWVIPVVGIAMLFNAKGKTVFLVFGILFVVVGIPLEVLAWKSTFKEYYEKEKYYKEQARI